MPSLIVAAGRDGAIGRRGDLIWHLREDLRHFKKLTMGHPIIMGRKTWESLPKRPLPGRENIVVTRRKDFAAPGARVASSPEEALEIARSLSPEDPFVIGGEQIYKALIDKVTRIFLTEIDAEEPLADARLTVPPDTGNWVITEQSPLMGENPGFRFITYENRHNQ